MSQNKNAFSLIELLVVVSVLAILFAIVLPNLIGSRSRARDVNLKSSLNQMKTSLRLYYNDFQSYPNGSGGVMMGCGADGLAACPNADGSFAAGATIYNKEMPSADNFYYQQLDGGEGFLISAQLENASDQDAAASAAKCGIAVPAASTFYVCTE